MSPRLLYIYTAKDGPCYTVSYDNYIGKEEKKMERRNI